VDHDYVVDAAKAAKQVGCKHFNLVSSAGTNVNSPLLYPKTKVRKPAVFAWQRRLGRFLLPSSTVKLL
jgi:hypothetical protein